MFVDRVKIYAKAGDGGKGCVSFRREKFVPKGGPDGGNGGDGGDVILRVDPHTSHLSDLLYQPRLLAARGEHGRGKNQYGRSAPPLRVKVPPGTEVRRLPEGGFVADLVTPGSEFVLCKGGRGGRGNAVFRSSTHQAPREFDPGAPGEEGDFELELKTVADLGLVGFPNAGKSTLLTRISRARPKVGAYPFTTLHPVVGAMEFEDWGKLTIADIPGLVEGAHRNVGLGHGFLRHIERCRALVILLDMAGSEGRDPRSDYAALLKELELHNPRILHKPRLVVANKMDLPGAAEHLRRFRRKFRIKPFLISAEKGEGLAELKQALRAAVGAPPAPGFTHEHSALPSSTKNRI
ncbi:MAG: GTPase ObgE [Verrucomicrobiae bacterium]|nr:GTPase ObgE [Verrucomicrobiae bacterium]